MRTLRTKGRKKFRSAKKTLASLPYTKRGFAIRDGQLRLASGTDIPVVWSRDLPCEPCSVRVHLDGFGHSYASFVVQVSETTAADTDGFVGIDSGVNQIATGDQDGYDLSHPQYGKRGAAALTRHQQMMARRQPPLARAGSQGYRAAKLSAAKANKKVARQRQDTARKRVRLVVADHQNIAVEDFKPRFLAKSTMARKSADGAVGATKAELVEYARRVGRKVVLVPPAYTTMTCSRCFVRTRRLPLDERVFPCLACGFSAGRDRNAAKVIVAMAGYNHADVDAVRHSGLPSGEVGVLAESGILRHISRGEDSRGLQRGCDVRDGQPRLRVHHLGHLGGERG